MDMHCGHAASASERICKMDRQMDMKNGYTKCSCKMDMQKWPCKTDMHDKKAA
jgi:hypothetical protein